MRSQMNYACDPTCCLPTDINRLNNVWTSGIAPSGMNSLNQQYCQNWNPMMQSCGQVNPLGAGIHSTLGAGAQAFGNPFANQFGSQVYGQGLGNQFGNPWYGQGFGNQFGNQLYGLGFGSQLYGQGLGNQFYGQGFGGMNQLYGQGIYGNQNQSYGMNAISPLNQSIGQSAFPLGQNDQIYSTLEYETERNIKMAVEQLIRPRISDQTVSKVVHGVPITQQEALCAIVGDRFRDAQVAGFIRELVNEHRMRRFANTALKNAAGRSDGLFRQSPNQWSNVAQMSQII